MTGYVQTMELLVTKQAEKYVGTTIKPIKPFFYVDFIEC